MSEPQVQDAKRALLARSEAALTGKLRTIGNVRKELRLVRDDNPNRTAELQTELVTLESQLRAAAHELVAAIKGRPRITFIEVLREDGEVFGLRPVYEKGDK